MSRFARQRSRKVANAGQKGVKKAAATAERTQAGLITAYAHANVRSLLTRHKALRNLSGVFLYAMHRGAGFGAKQGANSRLFRLRDKMQSELECITAGNVTVKEIQAFLRAKPIELDIDIISCDPKSNWYRKIEHKAVQELEASFLMALVDEFGYGKKRLERAYIYSARVCDEVAAGQLTYERIHEELLRIMSPEAAA
jgi:hypothetical protein